MTWSLLGNGVDLGAIYGFWLGDSDGVFDAPDRSFQEAGIYGRTGAMLCYPQEIKRRLTLNGVHTTTAKTVAARQTAEDQLKDALRAGRLRLVRNDGTNTARQITGYVSKIAIKPIGSPLAFTDSNVVVSMECVDSYWTEQEPTFRVLGATRATLPLGTAPSTPIIRIMGSAVSPVLTYRDASGTTVATVTVTGTIPVTTGYLDIDGRTGNILTESAVNGYSAYTILHSSGSPFPFAFDPQDGDFATSAWPSLSVSTGSGFAYWYKAYL